MQEKLKEFSFEVKANKEEVVEIQDVQEIIEKAQNSYRILYNSGRFNEAREMKQKLIDSIFAKEHLIHVMNLDFTKPTAKMIKLARENNIDINDQHVINEFRKI